MQQTTRTTRSAYWLWAAGAFVLVLAATMLPTIGVVVAAPLASLAIGAGAAWWVRGAPGATAGRATAAAAMAGTGALLASMAAFTVFGFALGSDPGVQEFIRGSEPHPEARIPYAWIAPLGAFGGALVGLGVGLINLVLAGIGGLLAGIGSSRASAGRPA